MDIGLRIRQLRERKGLSQRDIERKTGMMACYVSFIENGYKIPSLPTIHKLAVAMDVPLYQFFCRHEGKAAEVFPETGRRANFGRSRAASQRTPTNLTFFRKLLPLWMRIDQSDRQVILTVARALANPINHVPSKRSRYNILITFPLAASQK